MSVPALTRPQVSGLLTPTSPFYDWLAGSGATSVRSVLNAAEARGGVVANDASTPGTPSEHVFVIPAGITGNVDFVITNKTMFYDFRGYKTGAAGGGAGTVQVFNGGDAITDAIDIDVADEAVLVAATIADAFNEIAAGGTLRFTRTRTGSTDEACIIVARGVLRA